MVRKHVTAAIAPSGAQSTGRQRLVFLDPTQREAHIRAFRDWLPAVLQNAPGIDWDEMPSGAMGYLIRRVADSPDAVPIALACGCALHSRKGRTLMNDCSTLTRLLEKLRRDYGMTDLSQLKSRKIWDQFVMGRILSSGESHMVEVYHSLANRHVSAYLQELSPRQRVLWEPYALPPQRAGFVRQYWRSNTARDATQQRRKEQSDVLVPLFPLLVEIAQLRKQSAERLITEFRALCARASRGEIDLPYQFQFTDRKFSVTEDATSVSSVELFEREVPMSFTLWDKHSWVREHLTQYDRSVRYCWRTRTGAYTLEKNSYFLHYEGLPGDLLWCGDLIVNKILFTRLLRDRAGFRVSRPGLMNPASRDSKFLEMASRFGDVLFEPECLYRAVLFGAALATLVLTNGSRLSELLQVSAIRFEPLVVDELKQEKPTGRKIGILVQSLLPKGYTQDSERQYFLISDMAVRLLREIGELLKVVHGSIPVVHPYQSSKDEDLKPEPYFFQWAASDNGRFGLLQAHDVGALLRLLFHGLTLTTRTGVPIRVTAHLLRHVMATHVRNVKMVPAEAVAYLLHHRVTLSDSTPYSVVIPDATAYYSRMPAEQLFAALFEMQSTLSPSQEHSYLPVPSLDSLEQKEAALRKVFEEWGLLGPTALGFCAAGLCIRPNGRALCLNCPFLVPHYSNLSKAKVWRKLYVLQTKLHEEHGHTVDARQTRQLIQYLDDIITVMLIQIRTRQDGGYLPFADSLPPAVDDEGVEG